MIEQDIKALLHKYKTGTATDEEKAVLDKWYLHVEANSSEELPEEARLEAFETVRANLQALIYPKKVRTLWPQVAAAASVICVLSIGGYFLINRQPAGIDIKNDVAPYSAAAILKSGGKTILLDSTANGKIAETMVTKSAGEQLTYESTTQIAATVYDTIQIPAGGRPYAVKLTDGTKITLNAATTLRYPEAFSKNRQEKIELISGEIYAEVVHNAAAPLQITAPGQVITDIGTQFNIAAYPDDADSRTTLIEGAVKVNAAGKEQTLLPGRQTILTANNLTNTAASVIQVTAWKEGLFRFNGEHIEAIMRQLSRWYNIDVRYEGKVTDEVFYGRVARNMKISEVLRILERSNKVHFKVEGRRVTVLSRS